MASTGVWRAAHMPHPASMAPRASTMTRLAKDQQIRRYNICRLPPHGPPPPDRCLSDLPPGHFPAVGNGDHGRLARGPDAPAGEHGRERQDDDAIGNGPADQPFDHLAPPAGRTSTTR